MYQSVYYDRPTNLVHIWDDKSGYSSFPYTRYGYKKVSRGEFTTIHGDVVTKIYNPTKDEKNLFESDVHPETRVLVDMYKDSDEMSTGHTVLTYDIEVEMITGLPNVMEANNEITSIAMHDSVTDHSWVLILDKNKLINERKKNNVTILPFNDEESLLMKFINLYCEISPTIITGWNIDGFDNPYTYNRLKRVLGPTWANKLSPIGKVNYSPKMERYTFAGVSSLDFLPVYKNFNYTELPNYRLNTVAMKELNRGKVEYEGSLDQLFQTDLEKFIEYNLVDVELVVLMERKLKLIELCRSICHVGHTPYETYQHSSRYLEGAILTYLKKRNLVSTNKPKKIEMAVTGVSNGATVISVNKIPPQVPETGFIKIKKTKSMRVSCEYIGIDRIKHAFILKEKLTDKITGGMPVLLDFTGAWVKDPKLGFHQWVYDLDLTSLYPSIIMSLNISPETKVGKIDNWDSAKFVGKDDVTYVYEGESIPKDKMKKLLNENKLSVSSNGVLYRTEHLGFIPGILNEWFIKRVEYNNQKNNAILSGDNDTAEFYDKRQLVQKILLNSLYGVLGLSTFRFYDIDNAAAVTSTGQDIIKNTEKVINVKYNKEIGTTNEDYVAYCDTDSIFASAVPFLDKQYPDWRNLPNEDVAKYTDKIANDVQEYVNLFYNVFAKRFFNVDTHRFEIKKEYISESAFWVSKKRYAQKMVLKKGHPVNEMDVKGLDVKRSSFPKYFQELMNDVLISILDGNTESSISDIIHTFRDNMKSKSVIGFAKNSSLKTYKQYDIKHRELFRIPKGTPVAVKASMIYNDCLTHFGSPFKYAPLKNGDKIKWVYLKNNPYGFKLIAMNGYNDPDDIKSIIDTYVDREMLFDKELTKKLQDFYNALGWGAVNSSRKNVEKFFQF